MLFFNSTRSTTWRIIEVLREVFRLHHNQKKLKWVKEELEENSPCVILCLKTNHPYFSLLLPLTLFSTPSPSHAKQVSEFNLCTKTMKIYKEQWSHYTKEEATREPEDDLQEDQLCEALEQPMQVGGYQVCFCPTINPNGKPSPNTLILFEE